MNTEVINAQDLFGFDDLSSAPVSITPIFGGTDNCYLKRMEYTSPVDKSPRLEIQLERKVLGQKVEKHTFTWNDWRASGAAPAYADLPANEAKRLFDLIGTYRPDLGDDQIKSELRGLKTWKEVCEKAVSLLPPNYSELASTWYIRYRKNTDFLEIPEKWSVVKLGNGKSFKFDPIHDPVTPTAKAAPAPSPAAEFGVLTPADMELPF